MISPFDAISEIKTVVQSRPSHPLYQSSEYFSTFISHIETIIKDTSLLSTRATLNALLNKLQLKKEQNIQKYFQGICELMLWMHFAKNQYPFTTEKKISPHGNYDVDIQVVDGGYTFNIEVKCPVVDLTYSPTAVKISTPFRTVSKQIYSEGIETFEQEFIRPILQNSSSQFTSSTIEKINDNKMMEYLKSAQTKFVPSDNNSLNILFVGLPINQIENYFAYLENGFTGIFTGQSPIMNYADYNKTDVVIISALLEGHVQLSDTYDPWNINNYVLIGLTQQNTRCSGGAEEAGEELIGEEATIETEGKFVQIILKIGATTVVGAQQEGFQIGNRLVKPL